MINSDFISIEPVWLVEDTAESRTTLKIWWIFVDLKCKLEYSENTVEDWPRSSLNEKTHIQSGPWRDLAPSWNFRVIYSRRGDWFLYNISRSKGRNWSSSYQQRNITTFLCTDTCFGFSRGYFMLQFSWNEIIKDARKAVFIKTHPFRRSQRIAAFCSFYKSCKARLGLVVLVAVWNEQ